MDTTPGGRTLMMMILTITLPQTQTLKLTITIAHRQKTNHIIAIQQARNKLSPKGGVRFSTNKA